MFLIWVQEEIFTRKLTYKNSKISVLHMKHKKEKKENNH